MVYKDYGYNTDNCNHVHAYILPPLMKMLSGKKDHTILDLGCGNGWLVNCLVDNGFNAYGVDASETGIDIARRKNKDRFFIQDLDKNDLPNELKGFRFNLLVSTEVIEHIYSPRDYIDLCKKILLEHGGGELILTTPYHGYWKNLVLSLSGKMDKHFTALWDGGHIKFWSRQSLTQLLQEKGFENIQFTGCGRLPFLWKSMMLHCDLKTTDG